MLTSIGIGGSTTTRIATGAAVVLAAAALLIALNFRPAATECDVASRTAAAPTSNHVDAVSTAALAEGRVYNFEQNRDFTRDNDQRTMANLRSKAMPLSYKNIAAFAQFRNTFLCPDMQYTEHRHVDGGKWLCGITRLKKQERGCIVYSFGSFRQVGFETFMHTEVGCNEIHTFDPTIAGWAPPAFIKFHDVGVSDVTDLSSAAAPFKTQRLPDIFNMLGHHYIDVLKIDVESYEYRVIKDWLTDSTCRVRPGVVMVEFHGGGNRIPYLSFVEQLVEIMQLLYDHGYLQYSHEPNMISMCCNEYAFIHINKLREYGWIENS